MISVQRFRSLLFTFLLLSFTTAAGAQVNAAITDCARSAPILVPEAMPEIKVSSRTGVHTLITDGPSGYRPVAVAVDGGYVLAGATQGSSGRDLLVAYLDTEAGTVRGGRVLGGSGDDVARAVAVDSAGNIVVVGHTNSADLVPGQRLAGRRDGFVLTLNGRTLKPISASYVGTEHNDSIDAVAVGSNGRPVLAGTSQGLPLATAQGLSLTTVFPREAKEAQTYFVAQQSEQGRIDVTDVFEAAAVDLLEAWYDCNGNLVLGVLPLAQAGCGSWPDLEYQMDGYNEDYHLDHDWNNPIPGTGTPPGGFGFHGLRWKFYRANSGGGTPYTADWTLAPNNTPIPKSGVACGHHTTLTNLESDVFLQGGVPTDPPGGWNCGQHTEVQELGLLAAALSQRWGSPTYTQFVNRQGNNDVYYDVGIEKTTFEVVCPGGPGTYNGETLDDLCDFSVDSVNDLTCSVSSLGVSGGNFFLVAKEFETSSWLPLSWFTRPVLYDTDWMWSWEDWHTPGDYIFDPPDDDAAGVEVIQTAARYMLPRMVQSTVLQVDRFEAGKLVGTEATSSYVRALSIR